MTSTLPPSSKPSSELSLTPISKPTFTIHQATTPIDLCHIKALFEAYTSSLNLDLSFQNYAVELASLPGAYATERGGALFLATASPSSSTSETLDLEVLGCVALRALPYPSTPPSLSSSSVPSSQSSPAAPALPPSSNDPMPPTCEIKRLYVTPRGRGTGVSKALVQTVISEAQKLGYRLCKLDTLGSMKAAKRLYEGVGFRECGRYYDTPVRGTVFMELRL